MSEMEKKIAETIKEAMPKMSDFDKGYILGKIEQIAADQAEHPAPKEDSDEEQKSRTA